MPNISIISKCNNNCKYCFQQDSYHNLNMMLSLDDIKDILEWCRGADRIAYLGGEPTLHPDIVEIVELTKRQSRVLMLSNLLGPTDVIEEIAKNSPEAGWLVNTTSREELKDLFETNLQVMQKYRIKIAFGITLMCDEEYDESSITNLIRIGKKYPDITMRYRLGIATPFHKNEVKLLNYDEPLERFCKIARAETPDVPISFDCSTNMCQVSPKMLGKLLEDYNVEAIRMAHTCGPIFDVMVDKSIKYCSSVPDDFIPITNYRQFGNWRECWEFLMRYKDEYMRSMGAICRGEKNCRNEVCDGICFAMTEYIRRQKVYMNAHNAG